MQFVKLGRATTLDCRSTQCLSLSSGGANSLLARRAMVLILNMFMQEPPIARRHTEQYILPALSPVEEKGFNAAVRTRTAPVNVIVAHQHSFRLVQVEQPALFSASMMKGACLSI